MLLSLFALPGYSWQKSFPEKDYVAYLHLFHWEYGDEEAVRYAAHGRKCFFPYNTMKEDSELLDDIVIVGCGTTTHVNMVLAQ